MPARTEWSHDLRKERREKEREREGKEDVLTHTPHSIRQTSTTISRGVMPLAPHYSHAPSSLIGKGVAKRVSRFKNLDTIRGLPVGDRCASVSLSEGDG
jgi:hypothetical protein